jgi:hypothetical protein
MDRSMTGLVRHTIPVRNLGVRRTGSPLLDISCRNKELVLERCTRNRKFLDVRESKSGRVSVSCGGSYNSLIAFGSLGRERDGGALNTSMEV